MVGDIILKIKQCIKQTFCLHLYRYDRFTLEGYSKWHIYECKKCGRIKSKKIGM